MRESSKHAQVLPAEKLDIYIHINSEVPSLFLDSNVRQDFFIADVYKHSKPLFLAATSIVVVLTILKGSWLDIM